MNVNKACNGVLVNKMRHISGPMCFLYTTSFVRFFNVHVTDQHNFMWVFDEQTNS